MSMPALAQWMGKWTTADKHQTQGVYRLAFKKGNLADSTGSLAPWAFFSYMVGRRCLEKDIDEGEIFHQIVMGLANQRREAEM